ncbi:MAG: hypothetical protein WCP36_09205, partial [Methanomicrobiales archaeon]
MATGVIGRTRNDDFADTNMNGSLHPNHENALFKISLAMGTFRHFHGKPCTFLKKNEYVDRWGFTPHPV